MYVHMCACALYLCTCALSVAPLSLWMAFVCVCVHACVCDLMSMDYYVCTYVFLSTIVDVETNRL